jgi:hypothetical protein
MDPTNPTVPSTPAGVEVAGPLCDLLEAFDDAVVAMLTSAVYCGYFKVVLIPVQDWRRRVTTGRARALHAASIRAAALKVARAWNDLGFRFGWAGVEWLAELASHLRVFQVAFEEPAARVGIDAKVEGDAEQMRIHFVQSPGRLATVSPGGVLVVEPPWPGPDDWTEMVTALYGIRHEVDRIRRDIAATAPAATQESPISAGPKAAAASLDRIVTTQGDVARFLGKSPNTSGFIRKLLKEGVLSHGEKISASPRSKYHVVFADAKQHERFRQRLRGDGDAGRP